MNSLAACALIGAAGWPPPDPAPPSAADAVRAAAADCARLDPATAGYTRYLSAHNNTPAERRVLYAVLCYHANAMSREGTLSRPRKVNAYLWAVDLRDYRWDKGTYGQLVYNPKAAEPYFHVVGNPRLYQHNGADYLNSIPAPWLPVVEMGLLAERTGSGASILRADWFLDRTALQEGRDGFGYLDFLYLTARKDAEALAGLDRKKAEDIFREQAGIIALSGVAAMPRQVFRYSTVAGAWWETRDVKAESFGREEKNAVRLLLNDYKHDAEEIVFTLPNRLPGYFLSDAAGKLIRSAPPDVASDKTSRNNDARVHVALSCVRCHVSAGLKPLDDYARRVYRAGGPLALGASDDAKYRRLKAVYLGPLERAFAADVAEFTAATADACGLTPAGLSKAMADRFSAYLDEPVTAERAAAECGVTPAEFAARLKGWAARNRLVDPVLAGLLAGEGVRREMFEEAYPLLMPIIDNEKGKP